MKSTLEEILFRYDNIKLFNQLMYDKKYVIKDLIYTFSQEKLLKEIYEIECYNILKDLLFRTCFRELIRIEKGEENLVDIIKNPLNWGINKTNDDSIAWVDSKVLIFTTEDMSGQFKVNFSHVSRGKCMYKYIDSKWQ